MPAKSKIKVNYSTVCISRRSTCHIKTKLTSSTFWAVLADASKNKSPFSFANCSPSSLLTALRWARSALFPTSIIDMLGFACCRASSNQLAKWLKVSLLLTKLWDDLRFLKTREKENAAATATATARGYYWKLVVANGK